MGLGVRGGGCRLVLPGDRPSDGGGGVVTPESRGWRGQKCWRLGCERSGAGSLGAVGKGKSRERRGSERQRLRGQLEGDPWTAWEPARLRMRVKFGMEWRRCRMEGSAGRGGGIEENVGGVVGNF